MTKIDQQDAQHVLFHFSPRTPGATEPGGFTTKLLLAYSSADFTNRARLAMGFPSLAAAFDLVNDSSTGLDELSLIATGRAAAHGE